MPVCMLHGLGSSEGVLHRSLTVNLCTMEGRVQVTDDVFSYVYYHTAYIVFTNGPGYPAQFGHSPLTIPDKGNQCHCYRPQS